LEGNPYLLALTMVVSLLHSLFDFLAFKNGMHYTNLHLTFLYKSKRALLIVSLCLIFSIHVDIQFWNKNKSMEGLSAKSVVLNFICQVIIFLYLLDNETSWMILFSSGTGLCIEFWKIGKAMHVEVMLSPLKELLIVI
jgi:Cleft lip and palate transmembrane protein 1 (CLPTM1)